LKIPAFTHLSDRRILILVCWCLALIAILSLSAQAQETVVKPKKPRFSESDLGIDRKKIPGPETPNFFGESVQTQVITLQQAVEWALSNNLDVKVQNSDLNIRNAEIRFEAGVFDPVFSISASREKIKTPDNQNKIETTDDIFRIRQIEADVAAVNAQITSDNLNRQRNAEIANVIQGALGLPLTNFDVTPTPLVGVPDLSAQRLVIFDQETDRAEMSLSARSPLGTRVAFSARSVKSRSTFEGNQNEVLPDYFAGISIEARQPLLKGFGTDANLAGYRIAKKNRDAQLFAWQHRIEEILGRVVSRYYDMMADRSRLKNRGDAILAAMELVARNKRWQEMGFFSPFEVQEAKVQLSREQESLLIVKNNFVEGQIAMKRLVLSEMNVVNSFVYLPTQTSSLPVPKIDRSEFMREAVANRLDYKAVLADAEAQEIRMKFFKNQAWPQLDLVGSYGWNGLDGSYSSSFDRVGSGYAPEWRVGIQGSIPLGNVQARAQISAERARKEKALLQVKQKELDISNSVDLAISLIETGQQRLQTARETTRAAEEAVRIGYGQLEEGLISNSDLINQQTRLYESRDGELQAQAALNSGIVELWFSTGTVMNKLGVGIVGEQKKKNHDNALKPVVIRHPPVKTEGR